LTYRARNQRIRVLLTLCVFEGAMPVIGMLAGRGLALAVAGRAADYAAAACVGLMGVLLLREGDEEVRAETALSLPILMGLGLSVSLDELALGFGAGLLRLPLLTVVVWVAVQACVAVAAGLWLADAVGARLRENLEGLAGVVLLCLAVGLVVVTARG
jgi:putative Mn2+ efflux pump MntP